MALRVSREIFDFFPLPSFHPGQGSSGLFLANKILLKVATDIFSWFLISFRGTLAFQSGKKTHLSKVG
jgi:hypothetical protein